MPRYIDLEEFAKIIKKYVKLETSREKDLIRWCANLWIRYGYEMPTVDVQEVKHGKWKETVPTTPKSYRRICSVCCGVAYMIGKKYSYCPHCGAKMDLEEKENG